MATIGDIGNNIGKLQAELKKMRYGGDFSSENIKMGVAEDYIPIYYHVFCTFSRSIAKKMSEYDLKPATNNCAKFIGVVYRILRHVLNYNPVINREQFLQSGFAERKVLMCIEVIQMVCSMHTSAQSNLTGKKLTSNPSSIPRAVNRIQKPARSSMPIIPKYGQTASTAGTAKNRRSTALGDGISAVKSFGSQQSLKRATSESKESVVTPNRLGSRHSLNVSQSPQIDGNDMKIEQIHTPVTFTSALQDLKMEVENLKIAIDETNKRLDELYVNIQFTSPS